jgi:hypothetical protein
VIDTLLTQIGNLSLKPALRRHVFVELSLWDKLKITPQLNLINDGISEVYDVKEYKLYRTFENIRQREYSLNIAYRQRIRNNFHLNGALMPYRDEAYYNKIRKSTGGWIFRAEADYYHPASAFGAQVGYYRNMKKNALWQGYQLTDKDYWLVTLRKELWHKRISATLSYIPPVAFGVRYDRAKEIDSPQYKEKTIMDLRSYNQMLLLKVSVRFDRGSTKPAESRTEKRTREREQ